MMSKKRPQLRFEGFTDDWEQRKLGDVISISSEKNGNQFSRADVLSVSREAGVVNQIEYQGRSFAGASIANYRVVHKGDLIYTKSPLKGAPNGIFKTSEAEGIVSPLYAVYQSREANAAFVGWLLSNDNFATHYLYPLVNKGSKNTLLVSDADAISGHLSFPNIDEQAKIVSFFTQLDNLIALHQRKLDLLKEQKKGYLQKMFPKNGEKVPELRFAGFADDWEERKLAELATMNARIGWQNLRTSEFLDEGDYILITGTDFKDGEIDYSNIHYVEKERFDQDKKIQVQDGSILITKDGTLGKVAYVKNLPGPATLNAGVFNVRVINSDETDSKYLFHYLKAPFLLKFADEQSTGGTIKHLNQNVLVKFPVPLPGLDEQKRIANLLESMDNLIAANQRKLDLLKEQKKGFLQKMFV